MTIATFAGRNGRDLQDEPGNEHESAGMFTTSSVSFLGSVYPPSAALLTQFSPLSLSHADHLHKKGMLIAKEL